MKREGSWTENADLALSAVAVIWVAYILNYVVFNVDFRQFGIRPRQLTGLVGIVLCPFLHLNLAHIIANSIALFFLLTLTLSFSRRLTALALLFIVILGGGIVWFLGGGGTTVIGASGVVFGLIGFLLAVGPFRGEWRAAIFSLVVFFFYGGTLLTLLHQSPGTSWLGHVAGLVVGILVAWWTRQTPR
jgi:membrane associated rhomboid family serine protease